MDIRGYIEEVLGKREGKKFAKWALGKEFESLTYSAWPARWNSLHAKDLTLLGDGHPVVDIPRMIDVWRKYVP